MGNLRNFIFRRDKFQASWFRNKGTLRLTFKTGQNLLLHYVPETKCYVLWCKEHAGHGGRVYKRRISLSLPRIRQQLEMEVAALESLTQGENVSGVRFLKEEEPSLNNR